MIGVVVRSSILIVILLTLVGCNATSSSLQENRDAMASWVGTTQNQLIAVWGKDNKISKENQFTRVTYVFSDIKSTIKELNRHDLDRGPKTQGFDNDLLAVLGRSFRKACIASFLIDRDNLVVKAELSTMGKEEAACADPEIPVRTGPDDA